jgi:hypothetical protein
MFWPYVALPAPAGCPVDSVAFCGYPMDLLALSVILSSCWTSLAFWCTSRPLQASKDCHDYEPKEKGFSHDNSAHGREPEGGRGGDGGETSPGAHPAALATAAKEAVTITSAARAALPLQGKSELRKKFAKLEALSGGLGRLERELLLRTQLQNFFDDYGRRDLLPGAPLPATKRFSKLAHPGDSLGCEPWLKNLFDEHEELGPLPGIPLQAERKFAMLVAPSSDTECVLWLQAPGRDFPPLQQHQQGPPGEGPGDLLGGLSTREGV